MFSDSRAAKVLSIILIAALFSVSLAASAAVADDYLGRETMPLGAAVAGQPVGGLSRAGALAAVEQHVSGPLMAPATVSFKGTTFTLDPATYATLDIEGMLADALAPKVQAPLYARVLARVTGAKTGTDVPVKMKVDEARIAAWLAEVNPQVTKAAVDASLSVGTGMLRIIPEVEGATIDATAAPLAVSKALISGEKNVELPAASLEPSLSVATLGKTIFVKVSQRRLYLYNGDQLEKEYGVAVGTPSFPTPKGWFTIINKRRNPSWSNPGSSWAASMPARIAPGPSNPLGTRALDLDAPGIRIHGTNKDYSIGTAASHGCMRMHRWDIEDLFERVPVGTRVIIVS